ncbi:hypothetical protein F4815DRAFT_197089 [Daldinia loculata]|nr:hypothetical protein F4815DRAFT_197089 [Daldinia loculata]
MYVCMYVARQVGVRQRTGRDGTEEKTERERERERERDGIQKQESYIHTYIPLILLSTPHHTTHHQGRNRSSTSQPAKMHNSSCPKCGVSFNGDTKKCDSCGATCPV